MRKTRFTESQIIKILENDPRYTDRITITNRINDNTIVLFDEDHLIQLIMNIFINSLEELKGEGEIFGRKYSLPSALEIMV